MPTFNGGNAYAGITGNDGFILYDSSCYVYGVFSRHDEGGDCAIPYVIDYFADEITITSIFADVGNPEFTFEYGSETYDADEDEKCGGCGDLSDGLRAEVACKCGFYVEF